MTTHEAIAHLRSAFPRQTVTAQKALWSFDHCPDAIQEEYNVSIHPLTTGEIILVTGASLEECVTKATAHLNPSAPNLE
jgi:hypothetical protein